MATSNRNNIETRLYNQNNNEEISDIDEAKVIISQLKRKLIELEHQLEKYKIISQVDFVNKNFEKSCDDITDFNLTRNITEPKNREFQTANFSEVNKLSFKPVINIPDPVRTNVNNNNVLALISLDKNETNVKDVAMKPDARSDRIENYCKLNKSRELHNKVHQNESIESNIMKEIEIKDNEHAKEMTSKTVIKNLNNYNNTCFKATCENTSDTLCKNIFTSNESTISKDKSYLDLKVDVHLKTYTSSPNCISKQVLYAMPDKKQQQCFQTSQISKESYKEVTKMPKEQLTSEFNVTELNATYDTDLKEFPKTRVNHSLGTNLLSHRIQEGQPYQSSPPPLPGMPPPPPPMPGTFLQTSSDRNSDLITGIEESSCISKTPTSVSDSKLSQEVTPSLLSRETCPLIK